MNDQSIAAQPLQPPTATMASEPPLTLTAPAPVTAVATTAAPTIAPAVDPAALPGLDAKVEELPESLMGAEPRSPEFAAKATDVRTMGDARHPPAAESCNRLLSSPVKALQEGGLSEGSKVGVDAARAAPHRRGPRPGRGHRAPRSCSA